MTNTRKIKVPEIPSTEYWEIHNKSGTKGAKVVIAEDTEPENSEPEIELIISDETIRSRLKAKPDNDLRSKILALNASANLRNQVMAMSDEQFKALVEDKENEFLKILLGEENDVSSTVHD